MASTYSTNLGIELPGTGDQAGVWGNTTNTNLGTLIEQAISGYVTQAVATGTDTTITIPNGATGVARNMYIELTGTGGASTNLIVPANKKLYFIFNNTSSGQVTVKVSGQTGISVPNGKKMILVSNGTDIVTAENYVASLSSDNLTLTGTLAVGSTSTFTGAATFSAGTANQVQYLNASKVLTGSANLTFDGTTLTANALTLTNNPTLSGGTANGVLYLNGSKVATSGSALVFDGTNLGVGTSNPAAYGTVAVNAASAGVHVNATTGAASFKLYEGAGTGRGAITSLNGSDGLAFLQGTTEGMRLTSTGLGIGTASPSTKLQVIGNTKVGTGAASNSATFMVNNLNASATGIQLFQDGQESWIMGLPASSTALTWANSGSEKMRLDTVGNLGIGTTSPSTVGVSGYTRLVLGSGSSATDGLTIVPSGTGGVQFTDAANVKKGYLQWDSSTGALALGTAGTTKATIDTSGNLGLGTASPGYRLHVVDNSTGTQVRVASSSSGGTSQSFINTATNGRSYRIGSNFVTGTGEFALYDDTASAARLTVDSSGNLGLGVTPSAWAFVKAFQIQRSSLSSYSDATPNASTQITTNGYYDGNWKYIASGIGAAQYNLPTVGGGSHQWFVAGTGTAGNTISGFSSAAMTLDASANLGVGTTSPSPYTGSSRVIHVDGGANAAEIKLTNNASGASGVTGLLLTIAGTAGYLWNVENDFLSFGTNNGEKGRFTAGGDLLVGITGNNDPSGAIVRAGLFSGQRSASASTVFQAWNQATTGDNLFVQFYTEGGGGTLRGSIDYNRAGGLTRYNTTSDYRAKDVYGLLDDSGETIDALKVYRGKMHGATMERPMLIAHEAQEVAPYAVTGEKDAVNDDGTPKFQQMDTSSLVPLLIAEIQSLRSRVAALEAK